ncbi:helix-turn-helix transcriptional regulator [Bacillus spongiae]|uniref:Helix-turn-helix transcriptional regulator n=1 Tax=Bacillus spongiae TaxID=2683610 RepID=A0ABU8HK18_9BACI
MKRKSESVTNFMKEERLRRHLNQEKVADYVGISRNYYTEIETGRKMPSLMVAIRLSEFFGFDVREFAN